MTEWTDDELAKGTGGECLAWPPTEAKIRDFLRRMLARLGAVHPIDAREQERLAYLNGWTKHGGGMAVGRVTRDELYPSLRPKELPPLVLSTGTWYAERPAENLFTRHLWRQRTLPQSLCLALGTPIVLTSSDSLALGAWYAQNGTAEERV